MRAGWDTRFTVDQLDELRTLVTEIEDWAPGSGRPATLTLDPPVTDNSPPVGSFLHRLALEF